MRQRIHILTIWLLSLCCLDASAASDNRTIVTEVKAVSNIADILGYGKERRLPTFTIIEGTAAHVDYNTVHWEKKNANGEWEAYKEAVFSEGIYRVCAFWLIDGEYGTTHKLDQYWTLTVDSEIWETETPETDNFGSYGWAWSPEIIVGESGIQGIIADNSTKAHIYNLQGIIIKHNASEKDLHSLPAGIYIMNGKKVVVK